MCQSEHLLILQPFVCSQEGLLIPQSFKTKAEPPVFLEMPQHWPPELILAQPCDVSYL